jgi:predicted nuclease of predicted toxin-antitoxin system
MRLPAYIDECVHLELAPALVALGFEARSARDAGMTGKDDEQQLRYATAHGFVLLTHDAHDFRRLHRRLIAKGREHSGIIILPPRELPILTLRSAMMLDWLAQHGDYRSRLLSWGDVQYALTQGERIPGYSEADVRRALGIDATRT